MPIPRYPLGSSLALFAAGFRPFFLAAGIWACLAVGLWIPILAGTVVLPTVLTPVSWHFHELLFGFVAAAIAGFLLTAVPNWTGRLPLQGWRLVLLTLLWLSGRVAVALAAWIGALPAAIIDVAFLVVLAVVLGREIIVGRNWRNLPILATLALLTAANVMLHVGTNAHIMWDEVGKRLAIAVIVMLISFIGGRIIPSFTGNWLRKRGAEKLPPGLTTYDRVTLAVTALALAAWITGGLEELSGILLFTAAAAQVIRLARWQGAATISEPLLWILHVGYAWLPLGLAMLGAAAWYPQMTTAAIHALTAGAMGTMTVAVMTRASLGHSGRALAAGTGTLIVYLLILFAGVVRVIAPFLSRGFDMALHVAAGAWIAGFALFVVLYTPLYLRR